MSVRLYNENLDKNEYANFLKQLRVAEEALTEVVNITEDYYLNDDEYDDLLKALDTYESLLAKIQFNTSDN